MPYDVIIIGGSFAGLSAALPLSRARRRVLLVDAGLPRNRFASEAHGILGHDGRSPAEIRALGYQQLAVYSTFSALNDEVLSVQRGAQGFAVELASGRHELAARLILAIGVRDELPALPGLAERWGHSVLHCPYCHGYEVRDRPLGVLGVHPMSSHQALLLPDWGPTTFFSHDFPVDDEQRAKLHARGVHIESSRVVELLGSAPELEAVRLEDGRVVPLHALFTASKTKLASPLAEQLGCAFEEGPTGPFLRVDDFKQTSVPGVYAAGDATMAMHNGTFAAAAGTMAGVGAHMSLVMEAAHGKGA